VSKTPLCPFLKKSCIEHECMMYTHVQMTNPQTGLAKDEWTCSLVLLPLMQVESARCTRGVQAAVESMRNEVIKRQDQFNNAVLTAPRRQEKVIGETEWTTERLPKAT
jgi:hypothetical protein